MINGTLSQAAPDAGPADPEAVGPRSGGLP